VNKNNTTNFDTEPRSRDVRSSFEETLPVLVIGIATITIRVQRRSGVSSPDCSFLNFEKTFKIRS
jgi:hypothetical protein